MDNNMTHLPPPRAVRPAPDPLGSIFALVETITKRY